MKVGRYTLVGTLGAGAMAEVHAARLDGAGGFSRRVALKRIRPHLVKRPGIRDMLVSEGRLAAVLEHASILQVYELLDEGGEFGLVMEYADLGSLARLIATAKAGGKALQWAIVAAIGAEIAAALAYAHQLTDLRGTPLNVVHRDVSPNNILLTSSGGVKLADFGIAAARGALARGAAGEVAGKPEYMAREEAMGLEPSDRADVFSLGCVLWECLTLEKAFPSGARVAHEQGQRPRPLAVARPDAPAALCEAIERALAPEPADRPTAEFLSVLLRKVQEPVSAAMAAGGLKRYLAQHLQPVVPAPIADAQALPTPLATPAVSRTTPAPIGREGELDALLERFAAGARLVTLVGAPGMGKSAVAHHLVDGRGDRWTQRWFVSLQDAAPPWGLALAVSRALHVPIDTSLAPASALVRLGQVFAARAQTGRVLLVLDGAEAFGAALRQCAPGWFEAAPGLDLLVTSAERPGIGEAVLLGPLPLPSARALLRARAPDAVAKSSEPAIDRLIERLDRMPLALELAASTLHDETTVETLEARLAAGAPLVPAEALREALETLVSRLDEGEQRVFAQLSIFAGGFSVAAAAAIVELPPGTARFELVLERLLQRSMVRRLPGPTERYGLYELLRTWGLSRLDQWGLREPTAARHAAWFLREGTRWAAAATGRLATGTSDSILSELQNLLRVHQRALEALPMTHVDASNALACALIVEPVLSLRGPHGLLLSLLDSALAASASLPVPSPLLARALLARGSLLRELGRLLDAEADLARGLSLAESLGDERLDATARSALAAVYTEQARYELGREELARAEAIAARRGDRRLHAVCVGQGALIALEQGDFPLALTLYGEAMMLLHDLGDRRLEGIASGHLGTLHLEQGRFAEARGHYEASVGLLEGAGDARGVAVFSAYAGLVDAFEGRLEQAAEGLTRACARLKALGELRYGALFQAALGSVEARLGRIDEADAHLDFAQKGLEERGDAVFLQAVAVHRAQVAWLKGELEVRPKPPDKPPRDNDVRLAWRLLMT